MIHGRFNVEDLEEPYKERRLVREAMNDAND